MKPSLIHFHVYSIIRKKKNLTPIKKIPFILYLLLLLSSCEKEINFKFTPERKACVNCVLNPDSTVHLSLNYTRSLSDTSHFLPIKDAKIELFENDTLWGTGKTDSFGNFYLGKKPLEGKTYSLKITRNDLATITAETTVQQKPDISYNIVSRTKYPGWNKFDESTKFYNLETELYINDKIGKDHYWNYNLFWYPPKNKYNFSPSVAIISPYIDDFNRVEEPESQYGFYYAYYVRFIDDSFDGTQVMIHVESSTKSLYIFFNADEHYDKYMKSSIQQKLLDEDDFQFAEPVQIYSNIENGTGIFGSASFTILNFRNE